MPDLKPEQTNLETNLDNKPEVKSEGFGNSIRNAFGLKNKDTAKDTTKVPDKPEVKAEEVKPVEQVMATEKEAEFDEILYNKEKVKIPVTERQTYLQKGYNYDKVKTERDETNATLQRVAKVEGFKSVDEYLAELGNREKAKYAEQIVEADGDVDKIDEIVKNHPDVVKTKEERQALEAEKRTIKFDETVAELKKDKFFKDVEPEFNNIMQENPDLALNLVSVIYDSLVGKHLRSGKFSELLTKEKASAEKKVVADMHDAERRTVPKGGDTNGDKDLVQPTAFGSKIAGIFGVSATKVAQRSYEKMKRS